MKPCSCFDVKDLTVSGVPENRAADRLVAVGCLGESIEDDVVRRVVGGADLLQDHMLLAFQFLRIELGILQDVGENIDGQRHVVAQHPCIVGGCLDAGGGVDLTADILDFRGNLEGASPPGTLERHVFEQVGHSVLFVTLIAGARLDPGTKGNGFEAWKGFGGDCQAVRQTAYLNTHMDKTP